MCSADNVHISLPFLSEGLLFCCEHQISPLDQIMFGRSSCQGQASFAVGRIMLGRQQNLRNVVFSNLSPIPCAKGFSPAANARSLRLTISCLTDQLGKARRPLL